MYRVLKKKEIREKKKAGSAVTEGGAAEIEQPQLQDEEEPEDEEQKREKEEKLEKNRERKKQDFSKKELDLLLQVCVS